MPLILSLAKPITGVPAAKVKTNLFVMAAIREVTLHPRPLRQPRLKLFISVAANSPKMGRSVTVRIRCFDCGSVEAWATKLVSSDSNP